MRWPSSAQLQYCTSFRGALRWLMIPLIYTVFARPSVSASASPLVCCIIASRTDISRCASAYSMEKWHQAPAALYTAASLRDNATRVSIWCAISLMRARLWWGGAPALGQRGIWRRALGPPPYFRKLPNCAWWRRYVIKSRKQPWGEKCVNCRLKMGAKCWLLKKRTWRPTILYTVVRAKNTFMNTGILRGFHIASLWRVVFIYQFNVEDYIHFMNWRRKYFVAAINWQQFKGNLKNINFLVARVVWIILWYFIHVRQSNFSLTAQRLYGPIFNEIFLPHLTGTANYYVV